MRRAQGSRGVGERCEYPVGSDEIGLEAPARRVRVEVAQEDVDEEGLLEGVFRDADVCDPLFVGGRFGCCCCGYRACRAGGGVGGWA